MLLCTLPSFPAPPGMQTIYQLLVPLLHISYSFLSQACHLCFIIMKSNHNSLQVGASLYIKLFLIFRWVQQKEPWLQLQIFIHARQNSWIGLYFWFVSLLHFKLVDESKCELGEVFVMAEVGLELLLHYQKTHFLYVWIAQNFSLCYFYVPSV
jgi:hypothetical protein